MMFRQSFVLLALFLLCLSMMTTTTTCADHGVVGGSSVSVVKQKQQQQQQQLAHKNNRYRRRRRKLQGKGKGFTFPFYSPPADDRSPGNENDKDDSWDGGGSGSDGEDESSSSSSSSSTPNDDEQGEDDNKRESSSSSSPSENNGEKESSPSDNEKDKNEESSPSGNQDEDKQEESSSSSSPTSGGNQDDRDESPFGNTDDEDDEGSSSPSPPHENEDVVIIIPGKNKKDDENKDDSSSGTGGDNEEDAPGDDGDDENDDEDEDDEDWTDEKDGTKADDDKDDDGNRPANDFEEFSGDSMLDACVKACAGQVYESDESVFVPFEYQLVIPVDYDQEESIDLVDAAVQEYLTRELIFGRCHEYMDALILDQCPMDDILSRRRRRLQQQRRRIAERDLQAVRGVGIGFTHELLRGCSTSGDRNKVCSVMEGTSIIFLDEELAPDVDHAALIEDIALMIYKSGILFSPFSSDIQVSFKPPPGIAPDKLEDGDDADPGTIGKKENLPISVSGIVILIVGIIGVSVGSGYYMVKRNKRKGTRGMQLEESFDETGAPTRSSISKLSTPFVLTMGTSADDCDVEQEEEPVFDTGDSSNCDIGSPAQILAELQRQEHEEAFGEMSYEVDFPSHVQSSVPDLRPFSPKVNEEVDSQHEGSVYLSPRSYKVNNTVQL